MPKILLRWRQSSDKLYYSLTLYYYYYYFFCCCCCCCCCCFSVVRFKSFKLLLIDVLGGFLQLRIRSYMLTWKRRRHIRTLQELCRYMYVDYMYYIRSRIIVDSQFHPVLFMEENERVGHVSHVQIHIAT